MKSTPHDDKGPWWRVETRCPLIANPYVDWYRASDAAGATQLAKEDAHRYGLPSDATFTARLATEAETKAFT
jgi:hypothetical protein